MGQRSEVEPHNFKESLAASHAASDCPFWEEAYKMAFPNMVAMLDHRQDGVHQRAGIDRSVILDHSKQLLIDEKVRFRNKKTGIVYGDILLEYLSDRGRGTPGWVCKPLLADYIAYAISPHGKCYLLPVPQLQLAWEKNRELWIKNSREIVAVNADGARKWSTISCAVSVNDLFAAIGGCLRVTFTPWDPGGGTKGGN